ncbi:Hsp70 family protein [Flavobacterium sp.]|uniref:Hsp70 family protein n=1 Tax=Flavobacterium sp. TaxID=239 RepID=UPI00286ED26A|nr:Hsp70 family protein [Flavobacterium sp.]
MKINYGIYIGTSSASITKIEAGEICVLKSDTLKDEIPICVAINKKGNIFVGDKAYSIYRQEEVSQFETTQNSFIEITRTLGTDKKYFSSNANRSFSTEELLAEVIKSLLSFEKSTNIKAAVFTIPNTYKLNQIEALRKSANLAGLKQVEIIQEPVAAVMAYGLDNKKKDGFWLVFDFGGGTFDAALLKVEDGIFKVTDTESDNYLGGKNLDLAIVDEIIIPYIQKNYLIDNILNDYNRKSKYRETLRYFAKETRIKLSFNDTHNILSDLGDIPGEDDNGEEFELDITVTQSDMERALSPVFQKAIDISKKLLERNNLKPNTINELVLVGKETYSPLLQKMLEQQICKPDTTIDSENAIVKGAALYASTIDISEEIKEQTRDKSKIQIEIGYEEATVELEEFVTLKILKDKTEGTIPKKVFAEITRCDRAWSSGKIEINEVGEVIEVVLIEKKKCVFEIDLYDGNGNKLECEPSAFQIEQGKISKSATLSYNIGMEFQDKRTGKIVFRTISGLEKNKSLPAVGSYNGIKTDKPLRLGMDSDFIKISIYEGEHGADGTRAIYNNHINDIIISGADLPALLPENSDVDLTIRVDLSQRISVVAYFPYLDYSCETTFITVNHSIETYWLSNEIRKAKGSIEDLKDNGINNDKVQKAETEIAELERKFENNKNDVDSKQEVLTNLRKTLKIIDELIEIYSIEKKENYSLKQVEDLLFDLGTDSKITSEKFKTIYEIIQTELKQNEINDVFKELKSYE